jgi:hypothetical protein
LIPDTVEEKEEMEDMLEKNDQVRTLKDLDGIKIDFSIYDDKLCVSSLEDEIFAIVFESGNIVRSMKFIFEILWKRGKRFGRKLK